MLVERFAEAFDDPVLRWRAQTMASVVVPSKYDQWREWLMEDVGAVLHGKPGVAKAATPPVDLDGSRYLADIGWAAMHSALGNEQNDVWALFKSSRFGSFSHSHGDQNTFQLNAYGRALLIDSGYYPWYGSPHHALWYRQTNAHNGILVNGRGQPPYSWAANGDVEAYERKGPVTLVRGQAAAAYNQPQEPSTLRMWAEHVKEPVPPMEPKVESFERTMVFVSSKTRPVIFLSDYVRAAAPTTYDWLLHALSEMGVEDGSGVIRVKDGPARLVVRVIASGPVRFSQTNQFRVLPVFGDTPDTAETEEQRKVRYPDQWHLTAKTQEPSREARFLAVMVPYRESEKEPSIELMEGADVRGFRVDGASIAAWWGAGERGSIALKGLSGEGRTVVQATEGTTTHTVIGR
ncbi:MAG: heparinase II/III family protein [Acidobacteria bacterium]|nr:heparinase II/III family protein [Acidobacteriota bacterium]